MRRLWPYLTGLFSIVAATIVVYTFVSGLVKPKGKRLDVTVQQRSPLLNPAVSSGVDSLSLSVGSRALRNPQVVQLRFKSSGADPIRSTDFERPVSIRFKGRGEVVAANVVAPYPADLRITSSLWAGNEMTLEPFLMNPGDSFVASVLYIPAMPESNATDIPIEVNGRIAGVSVVGIADASQRRASRWPTSKVGCSRICVGAFLGSA